MKALTITRSKASEYSVLADRIREQLETIETALYDRVAPDDVTWSHVGDLEYVTSELADIVSFLTGAER